MSLVHERTEFIVPGPAEGLAALLGVDLPDLAAGEGLPTGWHWIYLLDRPAQADVGHDGHPRRNVIPAPPGPGRRRMWAGGQIRTFAPLRTGEEATRRTWVQSIREKEGRSGRLVFVAVEHEISQAGGVVIRERQDIVYRDAVTPTGQPAAPRHTAVPEARATGACGAADWFIETSPTLLFRFSALTYNGHRIHYDRDYACAVEGYPGLVVHGPLQALAMTEAARAAGVHPRDSTTFDYRLVAPMFEDDGMFVAAAAGEEGVDTMVRDAGGRQTALGKIQAS